MKNPTLYSRLYCDLLDHPKLLKAQEILGGHEIALGRLLILWTHISTWTTRQQTDGFIPHAAVDRAPLALPHVVADAFRQAGLLDDAVGGFQIHNWLKRNVSAETLAKRRRKDAEKKRVRRAVSPRLSPGDSHGDSSQTSPSTGVERADRLEAVNGERMAKVGENGLNLGLLSPGDSPGDSPRESQGESERKRYPKNKDHAENGDPALSEVSSHLKDQKPARASAQTGTAAKTGHEPRAQTGAPSLTLNGTDKNREKLSAAVFVAAKACFNDPQFRIRGGAFDAPAAREALVQLAQRLIVEGEMEIRDYEEIVVAAFDDAEQALARERHKTVITRESRGRR